MIKRKKPLLRKSPIKRSTVPLKRTAIKKTGKYCEMGEHDVPALQKSKSKVHKSCCSGCIWKWKLEYGEKEIKKNEKPKLISIPKLLEETEKVFNAWIRNRSNVDGYFTCISCSEMKPIIEMDAGHFWPKTYGPTRFHEDNVNGECKKCNQLDVNHLTGYKHNIKAKIGDIRYAALGELIHKPWKWERSYLLGIIEKYRI